MSLFFVNNSNLSDGNSDIKYLKSSSSKFPAESSKEVLQNSSESENTMFLLIIKLIYFSLDLGIT